MPEQPHPERGQYSDEELARYFADPAARRKAGEADDGPAPRTVLKALLLGVGAVALLGLLWVGYLTTTLPPTTAIENPEHLEATVVYTADGVELARYYLGQNRTWVSIDEISPTAVEALVAMEDRRFYDHWGVDPRGFAAVLKGAITGEGVRGASTITMQLARNLYNQIGFDRTLTRKVKEIFTAIQLERRYTKEEILEMYLNTVPFRYNAFGIEAAAQTYFDKPAAELEVREAATLIAMLAATTRFDPVKNPEASKQRRNLVMAAMVREGYLEEGRYEALKDEPTPLDFTPYSHTDNLAPHFAEILRKELETWGEERGYDIYTDGLVVTTTIDSRLQALAQAAVTAQAEKLQAVVDVEWSARRIPFSDRSRDGEDAYVEYLRTHDVEPWA
ncbi:MAG: transglycosylase domain-containing protein, partial [Rhodothermales bacterium]|nr:transglycosylase domain-containing protein [Rhodothermales bacterium]